PETWTTYNSFIIFRYAEAYLLRAEALVETGGSTDEAKSLIKVIRDRAGNTNDIDKMVAEHYNGSLRDLIRNERRVELAQEGLRFAD
ncbi:RagB/SusD family nutrient uptake outer membrane protein, partial [Klebsiella pneumoniae]|uniref:RagB/SusD family nutrient uptake outer membrane protein n=1 Tax=Klebsiella pneumoniae TaxID=573 RepID=UPI0039C265FF